MEMVTPAEMNNLVNLLQYLSRSSSSLPSLTYLESTVCASIPLAYINHLAIMYRNQDRNVLLFCIGCVHVVELRNDVERDITKMQRAHQTDCDRSLIII